MSCTNPVGHALIASICHSGRPCSCAAFTSSSIASRRLNSGTLIPEVCGCGFVSSLPLLFCAGWLTILRSAQDYVPTLADYRAKSNKQNCIESHTRRQEATGVRSSRGVDARCHEGTREIPPLGVCRCKRAGWVVSMLLLFGQGDPPNVATPRASHPSIWHGYTYPPRPHDGRGA